MQSIRSLQSSRGNSRAHEPADERQGRNTAGVAAFQPPDPALALVEDSLRDLTFADLAPLPPVVPDELVKMLESDSNRAKPDFCLAVADLLQLGATGEVQQV